MKRLLFAFICGLFATYASAQLVADDPDWKESQLQAPPAVDAKKKSLIRVRLSNTSLLQWSVDPDSIQVGKDGVVRYVVIAQSDSGVVNAMYEGIRCSKAEMRLYARYNASSGWVEQKDSEWQKLYDTPRSRHAFQLAKQGMCDGAAPQLTKQVTIEKLINPTRGDFGN